MHRKFSKAIEPVSALWKKKPSKNKLKQVELSQKFT